MLLDRLDHRHDGTVVEDTPEALIREARRQARRRRSRRTLTAVICIGVAGLLALVIRDGSRGRRPGSRHPASTPFVDARAFRDQGVLAFISQGAPWVLDGASGDLRRLPVPAGESASSPVLSPDGRWLAYLTGRAPDDAADTSQLWVAHGDGADAHEVRGPVVDALLGWSPAGDVLAVTVGCSTRVPFGLATAVDLVSASGRERRLDTISPTVARRVGAIESAVWSPDGRAIAVSTTGPAGTTVQTITLASPRASRTWFSIRPDQRLPGICAAGCVPDEVIADLAGWWPGHGVAFWVYSSGMVDNRDSTPLALLRAPGTRPRILADTLSDGITDAVSDARDGALALVASSNAAGRVLAQGKAIETCDADSCAPLRGARVWDGASGPSCRDAPPAPAPGRPGSGVSLDPAWSPDGTRLAYVVAPVDDCAAWPGGAWYRDHALYVDTARSGRSRRIAAAHGASLPTWSRDGRELLYVSDDGLWLTRLGAGRRVELEHPLFSPRLWAAVTLATNDVSPVAVADVSFYGQVAWAQQFSWASR